MPVEPVAEPQLERVEPNDYDKMHRHFRACFDNDRCLGGSIDEPCKKRPINSHTIARRWLRQIADKNHVRMPVARIPILKGRSVFESVGINIAGTKRLFCETHDAELFRSIETGAFVATAENALLLHFRAICSEFAAKMGTNVLRSTVRIKSDGTAEGDAAVAEWEAAQLGQQLGLQDIAAHYWRVLQMVRTRDFSRIRYLVCEFGESLPYAFVGSFMPEFDYRGRPLVDLADTSTPPDGVSASAFSDGSNGFLALTWEQGAVHSQTLAASLLRVPQDLKSEAGLILGLEHLENTCLSPDWWEQLLPLQRERHEARFLSSTSPETERASDCLSLRDPQTTDVPYSTFKTNDGALVLLT